MIVGSWFVSPLLAGLMSYLLLMFIKRVILRNSDDGSILSRLTFYLPYVLSLAVAVFALILMKGSVLARFKPGDAWEYLMFLGILCPYAVLVSQGILRTITANMESSPEAAEGIFRRLQVGTSSYVAFAHGANDVANAISPVFAIYLVVRSGGLPTQVIVSETGVPMWILVLGGAGIAVGIGTLGHRVIRTLSERITKLDNFKGFSVDCAAATTVVLASVMGMPVSSTHAATGAIVGTGVQEGTGIDFRVLAKIFVAWIVTVPVAAVLTVAIFFVLRAVL
jgi:PiT family inorganic phosphate transporter